MKYKSNVSKGKHFYEYSRNARSARIPLDVRAPLPPRLPLSPPANFSLNKCKHFRALRACGTHEASPFQEYVCTSFEIQRGSDLEFERNRTKIVDFSLNKHKRFTHCGRAACAKQAPFMNSSFGTQRGSNPEFEGNRSKIAEFSLNK